MSVVVTVFVMLIVSLIVIAFSQIAQREQRQSLDRQLSTQAYYAAESGINNILYKLRTDATMVTKKDTCDNQVADGSRLDSDKTVSYSCVLYDKEPKSLVFSDIQTDSAKVLSLKTKEGGLTRLTFSWKDTDGGADFSGCTSQVQSHILPAKGDYAVGGGCDAGMIRVMLMPIDSIDRESMVNSSYTVFIRPTKDGNSGASTIDYNRHSDGPETQGRIASAYCVSGSCTATIEGLPASNSLFLQMKSEYKENEVTITGRGVSNNLLSFTEAQIKIDSTGKAGDVLRRLQVRAPYFEDIDIPAYVIESMNGICKQIGVVQTGAGAYTANSSTECMNSTYFN